MVVGSGGSVWLLLFSELGIPILGLHPTGSEVTSFFLSKRLDCCFHLIPRWLYFRDVPIA